MKPQSLKLTAKQRTYVQSVLDEHRGDVELWDFVELERKHRSAEVDPDSGLTDLEVLRRNLRLHDLYSKLEIEPMVEINLISTDLRQRGVARRIAFNEPSDLRHALSLEARIEWVYRGELGSEGGGCYPEAWSILRALAAKDLFVAGRFFEVNGDPLSGGHRATVLLYNALLSIVTENEPLPRKLLKPLDEQRGPAAFGAMFTILGGIIRCDPSLIGDGLNQLFSTFRRLDNLFDEEKIICFLGHGLAELALTKNSELLRKFDCGQDLPWDAEYFEWLRGESPSPCYPELAKRNKLLDMWLNRLEIPRW
jgi:hypothetical protein